ncbi:hypothetical protein AOQ84DRAFT_365452 [Glonium stellatum]|uniref:Uncharacterized protein n=1 Tax=Glonium stellatum TaxID=574774 RepID=A0A8E2EY21_9PEZI|nr:hypothetical protein AOQ84DRAFT_365452 [Glonium stellatum]
MACPCACQCALRTAQKASSSLVEIRPPIESFENANGGISSHSALEYGLKFSQFVHHEPDFVTAVAPLNRNIAVDSSAPQEDESRPTSLSCDLYPSRISDTDCFLPEIGRGITHGRSDNISLSFLSPQGPQMSLECSNTGVTRQFQSSNPPTSLETVEHGLQMLGANHEVAYLVLREHPTFGQDPLDTFLRGSYSTFERLQDSHNYPK